MKYQGEHSGWRSPDGWVECTSRLPALGETVWVARWSQSRSTEYQVLKDSLFNPAMFLQDALQHGLTLYWMPIATEDVPAAPHLPDSLPEGMRETLETLLNRDEEAGFAEVAAIVARLRAQKKVK